MNKYRASSFFVYYTPYSYFFNRFYQLLRNKQKTGGFFVVGLFWFSLMPPRHHLY